MNLYKSRIFIYKRKFLNDRQLQKQSTPFSAREGDASLKGVKNFVISGRELKE